MTLVDTSVWIDHFEHVDARLLDLGVNQSVAMHPFVIGELAAWQQEYTWQLRPQLQQS